MTRIHLTMKQSTSNLGRWLKLLLWALLLQASLQQTASAHFFHDCRISLQADPPFPATIATQQDVGAVLYQGTLTWNYIQCLASMTQSLVAGSGVVFAKAEGSYALLTGTSTPQPVWGVSGLTVQADPPVFGNNFINTSAHQVNTPVSSKFNNYFIDSQLPNISLLDSYDSTWIHPPVSFSVSQKITIKASASTVSGRFPDPKNGGPLTGLDSLGPFQTSCRVGPWTLPIYFSGCTGLPAVLLQVQPWSGKPFNASSAGVLIDSTPQVPTIGGTTTVVQNCKPVLRSSITIPNLKTP